MLPCALSPLISIKFQLFHLYICLVSGVHFFLCFSMVFLFWKVFPQISQLMVIELCLYLMWSFKYLFSRNVFPHIWQASAATLDSMQQVFSWFLSWRKSPPQFLHKAFSAWWVPICRRRWYAFLNFLSHWLHENHSLRCLNFLWSLKAPVLQYDLPHTSHIYLSFMGPETWTFSWRNRRYLKLNALSHRLHTKSFWPVWHLKCLFSAPFDLYWLPHMPHSNKFVGSPIVAFSIPKSTKYRISFNDHSCFTLNDSYFTTLIKSK